jgi:predicted alpha/beta hydrolase
MKETIKVSAADGYPLSVSCFKPKHFNGKVVLINSASGVKQHKYSEFAGWLAENGFRVYTYDYRGIGDSMNGLLKDSKATMEEWGTKDYHAVLKYLFLSYPDSEFIVVGHSEGGQIIPLSPLSENVDLIVNIATQVPYWKHYHARLKMFAFRNILVPVTTKLLGYFPAKSFGLSENLPGGVALQWARWTKSENYVFDEKPHYKERFKSMHQPALMVSFADDELAPKSAVEQFIGYFKNVRWTHLHIIPSDIAQNEIGHFGFFQKSMTTSMWFDVVNWINRQLDVKSIKAA